MKLALLAAGMICLMAAPAWAADKPVPNDPKQKLSYSLGSDIAATLKEKGLDLDAEYLTQGIIDTLKGDKLLLADADIIATLEAFQKERLEKLAAKDRVTADENLKKGAAFLEDNKKKEGVTTLPSGLQYKILVQGSGKKPAPSDTVSVNYRGTLIDGTEFDSSYSRNKAASFQVDKVIPGWVEALQLMAVGSKWQLFLPANLAYGASPAGPKIGPNSALVFDVELLSIKE